MSDRKAIEAELDDIARGNGGTLRPEDVVERARNKRNPLHACFEWDNTAAAEQWRIEQARRLIRHVLVIERTETHVVRVAKYIRDPNAKDDSQGYVALVSIKDDEDQSLDALQYEFTRAIAVMTRAVDIASALGMEDRVASIVAQLCSLKGDLDVRIKRKRKVAS